MMKPKDQKRSDNVLALEKAAAWAWYQHGKTSMRESHVPKIHQRDHRPSRYKLEAMTVASSQETKEDEGLSGPVHHTHKSLPLLDAYEVSSILTRLDSLIAESGDDKLDSGFASANNGGQRKKKKKVGKGIWERRRLRVLCSARKEDVVDGTRVSKKSHQIKCSIIMPRINNGGRVM
ncbi:hypothetical protein K1719_024344 [Acacia pycnantha]|nr:hypothetical protein K1719_024344 [Acacia pycnantha]